MQHYMKHFNHYNNMFKVTQASDSCQPLLAKQQCLNMFCRKDMY